MKPKTSGSSSATGPAVDYAGMLKQLRPSGPPEDWGGEASAQEIADLVGLGYERVRKRLTAAQVVRRRRVLAEGHRHWAYALKDAYEYFKEAGC